MFNMDHPWGGEGIRRRNRCDQKDLEGVQPDRETVAPSIGCCDGRIIARNETVTQQALKAAIMGDSVV
jgi:hypothetical protein